MYDVKTDFAPKGSDHIVAINSRKRLLKNSCGQKMIGTEIKQTLSLRRHKGQLQI